MNIFIVKNQDELKKSFEIIDANKYRHVECLIIGDYHLAREYSHSSGYPILQANDLIDMANSIQYKNCRGISKRLGYVDITPSENYKLKSEFFRKFGRNWRNPSNLYIGSNNDIYTCFSVGFFKPKKLNYIGRKEDLISLDKSNVCLPLQRLSDLILRKLGRYRLKKGSFFNYLHII